MSSFCYFHRGLILFPSKVFRITSRTFFQQTDVYWVSVFGTEDRWTSSSESVDGSSSSESSVDGNFSLRSWGFLRVFDSVLPVCVFRVSVLEELSDLLKSLPLAPFLPCRQIKRCTNCTSSSLAYRYHSSPNGASKPAREMFSGIK